MLDVSAKHPFEACAGFAVQFIRHLANGDLAAAESLVDVNATGSPFAKLLLAPAPGPDGFSYAHPDHRMLSWAMRVFRADEHGLKLEFKVPFAEVKFGDRSLSAQFEMRRVGEMLEVRLTGVGVE